MGNQNAKTEDGLTSVLRLRCRPEEKGAYDAAARSEQLKTSEWVRKHLNEIVEQKP